MKFLIIRFSSIGDIVLTTPVVRCLKKQVNGAEVHYLTKSAFADILQPNPYIDKVHCYDGNLHETLNQIRDEQPDYIIDLHKSLRSSVVKRRLKLISFSFQKLNIQKWLLVNFKINRLPDVHIVDRYLQTLASFDVSNDGEGLDYFFPDDKEYSIGFIEILQKLTNKNYIAFVIGAKHATKALPADKIISICNKIQGTIILLGGNDDANKGDQIVNSLRQKVINACGKCKLHESAILVKEATGVISHDTGLMHIAAAFRKRIVSIWGNTVPDFGMYPYLSDKESVIVEVNNLPCRPCSKIGFNRCPKKHHKCMKNIDEQIVVQTVNKWLK